MSVGLHLTVEELKETAKEMEKIGAKFALRDYLKLIGNAVFGWVDKNFKTEGKAPGRYAPWQKLKPNTIAGRRKGSKKILQDTGRLRQSYVSKVHRSAQWVAIGTKDKRAQWHEYGTKPYRIYPKRKKLLKFSVVKNSKNPSGFAFARMVRHPGLPARPMLPSEQLGEKMAIDVLDTYVNHITKGMN